MKFGDRIKFDYNPMLNIVITNMHAKVITEGVFSGGNTVWVLTDDGAIINIRKDQIK